MVCEYKYLKIQSFTTLKNLNKLLLENKMEENIFSKSPCIELQFTLNY